MPLYWLLTPFISLFISFIFHLYFIYKRSYFYPVELTKFCLTFLFGFSSYLVLEIVISYATAEWGCAGAVLSHAFICYLFTILCIFF